MGEEMEGEILKFDFAHFDFGATHSPDYNDAI
jgi:hypothetical protein